MAPTSLTQVRSDFVDLLKAKAQSVGIGDLNARWRTGGIDLGEGQRTTLELWEGKDRRRNRVTVEFGKMADDTYAPIINSTYFLPTTIWEGSPVSPLPVTQFTGMEMAADTLIQSQRAASQNKHDRESGFFGKFNQLTRPFLRQGIVHHRNLGQYNPEMLQVLTASRYNLMPTSWAGQLGTAESQALTQTGSIPRFGAQGFRFGSNEEVTEEAERELLDTHGFFGSISASVFGHLPGMGYNATTGEVSGVMFGNDEDQRSAKLGGSLVKTAKRLIRDYLPLSRRGTKYEAGGGYAIKTLFGNVEQGVGAGQALISRDLARIGISTPSQPMSPIEFEDSDSLVGMKFGFRNRFSALGGRLATLASGRTLGLPHTGFSGGYSIDRLGFEIGTTSRAARQIEELLTTDGVKTIDSASIQQAANMEGNNPEEARAVILGMLRARPEFQRRGGVVEMGWGQGDNRLVMAGRSRSFVPEIKMLGTKIVLSHDPTNKIVNQTLQDTGASMMLHPDDIKNPTVQAQLLAGFLSQPELTNQEKHILKRLNQGGLNRSHIQALVQAGAGDYGDKGKIGRWFNILDKGIRDISKQTGNPYYQYFYTPGFTTSYKSAIHPRMNLQWLDTLRQYGGAYAKMGQQLFESNMQDNPRVAMLAALENFGGRNVNMAGISGIVMPSLPENASLREKMDSLSTTLQDLKLVDDKVGLMSFQNAAGESISLPTPRTLIEAGSQETQERMLQMFTDHLGDNTSPEERMDAMYNRAMVVNAAIREQASTQQFLKESRFVSAPSLFDSLQGTRSIDDDTKEMLVGDTQINLWARSMEVDSKKIKAFIESGKATATVGRWPHQGILLTRQLKYVRGADSPLTNDADVVALSGDKDDDPFNIMLNASVDKKSGEVVPVEGSQEMLAQSMSPSEAAAYRLMTLAPASERQEWFSRAETIAAKAGHTLSPKDVWRGNQALGIAPFNPRVGDTKLNPFAGIWSDDRIDSTDPLAKLRGGGVGTISRQETLRRYMLERTAKGQMGIYNLQNTLEATATHTQVAQKVANAFSAEEIMPEISKLGQDFAGKVTTTGLLARSFDSAYQIPLDKHVLDPHTAELSNLANFGLLRLFSEDPRNKPTIAQRLQHGTSRMLEEMIKSGLGADNDRSKAKWLFSSQAIAGLATDGTKGRIREMSQAIDEYRAGDPAALARALNYYQSPDSGLSMMVRAVTHTQISNAINKGTLRRAADGTLIGEMAGKPGGVGAMQFSKNTEDWLLQQGSGSGSTDYDRVLAAAQTQYTRRVTPGQFLSGLVHGIANSSVGKAIFSWGGKMGRTSGPVARPVTPETQIIAQDTGLVPRVDVQNDPRVLNASEEQAVARLRSPASSVPIDAPASALQQLEEGHPYSNLSANMFFRNFGTAPMKDLYVNMEPNADMLKGIAYEDYVSGAAKSGEIVGTDSPVKELAGAYRLGQAAPVHFQLGNQLSSGMIPDFLKPDDPTDLIASGWTVFDAKFTKDPTKYYRQLQANANALKGLNPGTPEWEKTKSLIAQRWFAGHKDADALAESYMRASREGKVKAKILQGMETSGGGFTTASIHDVKTSGFDAAAIHDKAAATIQEHGLAAAMGMVGKAMSDPNAKDISFTDRNNVTRTGVQFASGNDTYTLAGVSKAELPALHTSLGVMYGATTAQPQPAAQPHPQTISQPVAQSQPAPAATPQGAATPASQPATAAPQPAASGGGSGNSNNNNSGQQPPIGGQPTPAPAPQPQNTGGQTQNTGTGTNIDPVIRQLHAVMGTLGAAVNNTSELISIFTGKVSPTTIQRGPRFKKDEEIAVGKLAQEMFDPATGGLKAGFDWDAQGTQDALQQIGSARRDFFQRAYQITSGQVKDKKEMALSSRGAGRIVIDDAFVKGMSGGPVDPDAAKALTAYRHFVDNALNRNATGDPLYKSIDEFKTKVNDATAALKDYREQVTSSGKALADATPEEKGMLGKLGLKVREESGALKGLTTAGRKLAGYDSIVDESKIAQAGAGAEIGLLKGAGIAVSPPRGTGQPRDPGAALGQRLLSGMFAFQALRAMRYTISPGVEGGQSELEREITGTYAQNAASYSAPLGMSESMRSRLMLSQVQASQARGQVPIAAGLNSLINGVAGDNGVVGSWVGAAGATIGPGIGAMLVTSTLANVFPSLVASGALAPLTLGIGAAVAIGATALYMKGASEDPANTIRAMTGSQEAQDVIGRAGLGLGALTFGDIIGQPSPNANHPARQAWNASVASAERINNVAREGTIYKVNDLGLTSTERRIAIENRARDVPYVSDLTKERRSGIVSYLGGLQLPSMAEFADLQSSMETAASDYGLAPEDMEKMARQLATARGQYGERDFIDLLKKINKPRDFTSELYYSDLGGREKTRRTARALGLGQQRANTLAERALAMAQFGDLEGIANQEAGLQATQTFRTLLGRNPADAEMLSLGKIENTTGIGFAQYYQAVSPAQYGISPDQALLQYQNDPNRAISIRRSMNLMQLGGPQGQMFAKSIFSPSGISAFNAAVDTGEGLGRVQQAMQLARDPAFVSRMATQGQPVGGLSFAQAYTQDTFNGRGLYDVSLFGLGGLGSPGTSVETMTSDMGQVYTQPTLAVDTAQRMLGVSPRMAQAMAGKTYSGVGGLTGASWLLRDMQRDVEIKETAFRETSMQKQFENQMFEFGLSGRSLANERASLFGGTIGGFPTRGRFAMERASMALQEQDMYAGRRQEQARFAWQFEDLGRARYQFGVQTGWQRQDFGDQALVRQANRGWDAYQYQYAAAGLGLQRQYAREDFGYSQMMRGLQFGWQSEDYDLSIRRATGMERRQLIRQRDRSEQTYSLESSQIDRQRRRQEEQFDREEKHLRKQREHAEYMYKLEDKEFEKAKERFEVQTKWKEEEFGIQESRLSQQAQWSDEAFERQKASFEIRKEQQTLEEAAAKERLDIEGARLAANKKIAEELNKLQKDLLVEQKNLATEVYNYRVAADKLNESSKQASGALVKLFDDIAFNSAESFRDYFSQLSVAAGGKAFAPINRRDISAFTGAGQQQQQQQQRQDKPVPQEFRRAPRIGAAEGGGTQVIYLVVDGEVMASTSLKYMPKLVQREAMRQYG